MKKKKIKSKINTYIFIVVLLIFLITMYAVNSLLNKKTTNSLLLDSSENIVYTYYEDKDKEKEIPILNLKKLNVEVNESINSFVEPYINKDYNKIYYHYQINGNVLSLLLTIEDYEKEGPADVQYLSFIIDLKKNKILNNTEILNMFNKDEEEIKLVLYKNFKSIYEEEINKQIIPSNISYDEFLSSHEITNFIDQISYDIKDSKLLVYLDYNIWSPYEIEPYLDEIGHIFEIN